MSTCPLDRLVLLSVATTGSQHAEDGVERNIVLMSWIVLDVTKNQVISKDEVYVCPVGEFVTSSDLPANVPVTSLRGAGNLDTALEKLLETLTKLEGTSFSIMTNGPTPLRQYIHPEAKKMSLSLHKHLYHYIDLSKEITKAFPTASPMTELDEMAEFLGIDLSPGVVSEGGLSELMMVYEVVQKVILQGHVFQKLEVIQEYDNSKVTADHSLVKPDCVVLLRGLPYQATVEDVAYFLTGLNCVPGGIAFGTNPMGRRTGEAIVILEDHEQVELAQQRNRQYLNDRYIEVIESSPDLYMKFSDLNPDNVFVVRMQGLPYRATEQDIVDFFLPDALVSGGEDGVLLVCYPDGRASGDGYVVFDSEDDVAMALKHDKESMGRRYIDLFRSTVKDFKAVLSTSATPDEQAKFSKILGTSITANPEIEALRGRDRKCVKLRGLPWTSSADDVLLFFGEFKNDISLKGVHMVLNSNNRPTGDCYVQMKSEETAIKASSELNKKYIGNRYVEVFQCTGDEVAKALMEQGMGGGSSRGQSSYRGDRSSGDGRGFGRGSGGNRRRQKSGGENVIKARGLPFKTSESEISDFFAEYNVQEDDVELVYNRDRRPTGIAFITFNSRQLAEDALHEKNRKHIGTRYVELSFPSDGY